MVSEEPQQPPQPSKGSKGGPLPLPAGRTPDGGGGPTAPEPQRFNATALAEASGLPQVTPPNGTRLMAGFQGRLLVGVLPLWLFPNGHVHWVQRLHELPGAPRPLVVRTTHVFGGLPAKRHRLREAQLFADGRDYYYSPESKAPK
jgi:hypothetical protein